MTNTDFDFNKEPLVEFADNELTADFEALGSRAQDLLAAYRALASRYSSLESMYQLSSEENIRLHTELDLTREESRKETTKLRQERNELQRDFAMLKADVEAVGGTLINAVNRMRQRTAERARVRQPLRGAPTPPTPLHRIDEAARGR